MVRDGDWPREFCRQYALFSANEVTSAIRHELLNRMTALGALAYQLRRTLQRQASIPESAAAVWDTFPLLNDQIAQSSRAMERRFLAPPPETTPPCDLAQQAAALLDRLDPTGQIGRPGRATPAVMASIDPDELTVALYCLLDNALEATEATEGKEGPRAVITCARRTDGRATVEVTDHGPGLATEAHDHATERFFTTKPGHVGIGLNVARTIAARWQGTVEIGNRTDGAPGFRACLSLPAPPV